MNTVLHLLLSWQVVLFVIAIFVLGIIRVVRKHAIILSGTSQLLQSPSGVFGILTLMAITFVTWIQPTVGSAAFTAFVTIVPAILTIVEHREEMAKMSQQASTTDQTTVNVSVNDLPPRGQVQ